jgi:poly(3-hydroxybutyrate) depolymerase
MRTNLRIERATALAGLVALLSMGFASARVFAQQDNAGAAGRGAVAGARGGRGAGGFGIDPRAERRTYHFEDTGEDLPYCVFVSSKVSRNTPAPLILTLHGLGAGPEIMCNKTAVDLAEAGGYILASPMGYNTGGWYGIPAGPPRGGARAGNGAAP